MAERHVVRKGRVSRAAPLVGLAGRTAGEAVVAALGKGARDPAQQKRSAERYAAQLGRSKGVLMKAGQILSFTTLAPALGDETATVWQRALSRLQDDAPPMPAKLAAEVVERELGAPPERAFAQFAAQPLAAASIGQVHAARTHDGRDVVVKVQYPGVAEAIRSDLRNTELLATFFQLIRGFLPETYRIDARVVAWEVAERIGEEIDYRTEAANQTAFADAYRGHPYVRVPEVVPELSTGQVLTMERSTGMRFAAACSADQDLRDQWGEVLMRFGLGSLRRLGLFHADPHPGNYLFHLDGTVTFLDFGCVKRYSPAQVRRIQAMVNSIVDGDAAAAMDAFVGLGIFDPADAPDPEAALAWYRASLRSHVGPQPFTYTPEFAAAVVRDELSPFGPHRAVVTRASLDPAYVMLNRIQLGLTSVLGALHATGPWEAIRQEWDHGGPPSGACGELDQAFWAARV